MKAGVLLTMLRLLLQREAVRWLGLVLGPALAMLLYALLLQAESGVGVGDGLTPAGRATAAVAAWMVCWWLKEAVPLAAITAIRRGKICAARSECHRLHRSLLFVGALAPTRQPRFLTRR